MVYAFLIHSVQEHPTTWASFFFTEEGNDPKKKKREEALSRQVCEDHLFHKQCSTIADSSKGRRVPSEDEWMVLAFQSREYASATLSAEEGAFYVPSGEYFADPKVVLWRQVLSCAYTIVLEPDENRLLATNFLRHIVNVLAEHFKNPIVSAVAKEFVVKPDEVIAVIQTFLPNGKLLFLNTTMARHLRREVEKLLVQEQ